MQQTPITGSFAATGQSNVFTLTPGALLPRNPSGGINFSAWGTFVGTVVIERSFDNGLNWLPVSKDSSGAANSFTAPFSLSVIEIEESVQYRLNCTAYTSGTVNYRISA